MRRLGTMQCAPNRLILVDKIFIYCLILAYMGLTFRPG